MTDQPVAESSCDPSQADQSTGLDTKRTLIGALITIVVLVVVFVGIIPKFGSYSEALVSIRSMSTGWLVALVASVVLSILVFVLPYQAAIPGLKYGPAFVVRQTSFTISNAVPAGGALGLGVQYAMLSSYGVPGAAASSGIAITSVWSVFLTLGLPIIGVSAAVINGSVQSAWVVAGLVGAAAIVAALVVLWLILRSEQGARSVAKIAAKVARPVTRRMKSPPDFEVAILTFRTTLVGVVREHWLWITVSNLLVTGAQFLILFVAVRAVGGTQVQALGVLAAFAAMAISRLASMIPATPGGLGTVDAALIGLLVTFGVDQSVALAATLVWRCAQFVPQVLLGVVTFVWWRARQARTGGL